VKFFPLVWAMLWRSRTRTTLTFLSIAVAFLLFGLLQAVVAAFDVGARLAGADRMITAARFGLTQSLPLAHLQQIASVEGVSQVHPYGWFGGWYRDQKNPIPVFATDLTTSFNSDPRRVLPQAQLEAAARIRTGAIAGRDLAEKQGWKIGDRVPVHSVIWPKKDGSRAWEFEILGIYDVDRELVGEKFPAQNLFINYDYFDEERLFANGTVSWYTFTVQNVSRADAVGQAVDALFANSTAETKTQTEQEFSLSFIKQLGDIGLIVTGILSAVFFTLMLVAGNTMMQAFRERIPEFAVLKTLGFTDGRVAVLVVAESLLLVVGAGLVGLGLAALLVPPMADAMAQFFPGMTLLNSTVAIGVALAAGLGLIAAVIPAWKANRLTVVEALSGH
jgi:putative ABC transport system permease protein